MQMQNINKLASYNIAQDLSADRNVIPLIAKAQLRSLDMSEAGLSETADLIARMADRLMRQEQLLIQERARSAALELELAKVQPLPRW